MRTEASIVDHRVLVHDEHRVAVATQACIEGLGGVAVGFL